jgi:hypothetical protein
MPLNPSLLAALLACRLRRRRPLLIEALMLALAAQLDPFFRTCSSAEIVSVVRSTSSSPSQLQIASLPPPQRINEIHKALILTHCF